MNKSLKLFGILFLLAEGLSLYLLIEYASGDVFGYTIKILIYVAFLLIYYFKQDWGRWVSSIALVFWGLVCTLAGLERLNFGFLVAALLFYALGFSLHYIPALKYHSKIRTQKPRLNKPMKPQSFQTADNELFEYPLLVRRYQSSFIDFLFMGILAIFIVRITKDISNGLLVRQILLGILLLGYEPLLIRYKATLGQWITGIRVRSNADPNTHIGIFQAYVRMLGKVILGGISIYVMFANERHRAIHDFISKSVVINRQERED